VFKGIANPGIKGNMKTDISPMLTVKSGLDPHMIIELKDDLN
jgi:hypothetical protein